MTALALAPEATFIEPIVGWRVWRILPFQTLQGEESYRLCAAGTCGQPKVWEPRAATTAVCSGFTSTHEAPWPDCDCGIYAFRESEGAQHLLEYFAGMPNAEGAVGWAVGRVSLWGRVVECEKGWRGQFAYPYAVTVHAAAEVAARIGGLYAIDVEAGAPLPEPESEVSAEVGELKKTVAELRAELREIRRAMQTPARAVTPRPAKPRLPWSDSERSVIVAAAVAELATRNQSGVVVLSEVREHLELSWNVAYENLNLVLGRARLAGTVVSLSDSKAGVRCWSVPGQQLEPERFKPIEDRYAENDARVLEGFKAAAGPSDDGTASVRDVVTALGGDPEARHPRGCVAQALIRLEYRGALRETQRRPRKRWAIGGDRA